MGKEMVTSFANDVFDKADSEDRSGFADKVWDFQELLDFTMFMFFNLFPHLWKLNQTSSFCFLQHFPHTSSEHCTWILCGQFVF
jgi:hypothetical protein